MFRLAAPDKALIALVTIVISAKTGSCPRLHNPRQWLHARGRRSPQERLLSPPV